MWPGNLEGLGGVFGVTLELPRTLLQLRRGSLELLRVALQRSLRGPWAPLGSLGGSLGRSSAMLLGLLLRDAF